MKNSLNAKRLFLILTREFTLNKKNLLIIALSMVLVSIITTYFGPESHVIQRGSIGAITFKVYKVYPFIVLFYCAVITAYSFMELNTPDRKIDYLMTPASVPEKYLTKFIYTTFGFILLAILALAINTLFVTLLNSDLPYEYYAQKYYFYRGMNPLTKISYWAYLHYYLIAHSILFFAGVYFVKMELPKTILALAALYVVHRLTNILLNEFGVIGDIIVGNFPNMVGYTTGYMPPKMQLSAQSAYSARMFSTQVFEIIKFMILYIIPPFFWILGFLRLKEIEVKDGV